MAENFANNIRTTLDTTIDDNDTTVIVDSSTGAPAADFRILIDQEYMLVTAKAGDSWTVTRGIEGSTAAAHTSGAAVTHIVTAGGLSDSLANAWAMSKSSSQTLTTSVDNDITFDRTDVDGGGSVIDLANDRFVVPFTGLYMVTAHWPWNSTVPAAAGRVSVYVDGAIAGSSIRMAAATPGGSGGINGSMVLSLNSGDFVTMVINPGAATPDARGDATRPLSTSMTLIKIR